MTAAAVLYIRDKVAVWERVSGNTLKDFRGPIGGAGQMGSAWPGRIAHLP